MTTSDFEVANSVAGLLKDLEPERQVRILRWVSESLGIVAPSGTQAPGSQTALLAPAATPAMPPGSAMVIKTFIALKDPKSDNQFAAAVAYYYRFEAPQPQRADAITAEMLQEATRMAGRTRLGDPGKTLRNAKDQGYLDPAGTGSFKINSVGENLVAMTLSGEGRATVGKTPRKSAKKKGKGKR